MQFYFNPSRESDPYALPDGEVFFLNEEDIQVDGWIDNDGDYFTEGWYYWPCFPGCLPDSDPIGPFESAEAALTDARESFADSEE